MNYKRVILILLSLIFFANVVGCGQMENSSNKGEENNKFANGVHIYTANDTDKTFIENGQTPYKLVIPSNASPEIMSAAGEFNYFFEKATGTDLLTINDSNQTLKHSSDAKFISIGETSLLSSSGVVYDKKTLGRKGIRIKTVDSSIYLVGGSDLGSLYAVYDFMKIAFNFEIFYKDCYTIKMGITQMNLIDFDVTDIPDIASTSWYSSGAAYLDTKTYDNENYQYRARLDTNHYNVLIPVHRDFDLTSESQPTHNSDYVLPKATYGQTHPKWFSDIVDTTHEPQLCYTAHGDEQEFNEMTKTAAEKIIFSLKNYPVREGVNTIMIGLTDNFDDCNCDACSKLYEKYGTKAGAVCIFVNKVAEIVDKWMSAPENASYYREDFKILFFAYHNFTDAPVKYDEHKKKYMPIDEAVKLRDDVGVFYANILADYQQSMYSEDNVFHTENLKKWDAISNHIWQWTYAINYKYLGYFYDCYSYYTDDFFKEVALTSTDYLFIQGAVYTSVPTGWKNLLTYLYSELSWDCNQSSNKLIDKWFDNMFAEGAEEMRKFFDELRIHYATLAINNKWLGNYTIYTKYDVKSYWPLNTLRKWTGYCDNALKAVEKYKNSRPEYYNSLKNHIIIEWSSPIYMMFSLHFDEMSLIEKQSLVSRLEEYSDLVNFNGVMLGIAKATGDNMTAFIEQIKSKMG